MTFRIFTIYVFNVGLSSKGAQEIVRLAQRMVLNYYTGITGSSVIKWERIQAQNIQLMIRRNVNEPGEHTGLVLSASTSDWFPAVRQQTLFHFLSDLSFRYQWDILTLTHNTSMERTVHIQKAKRHENYISLLRVLVSFSKQNQTTFWLNCSVYVSVNIL